MDGDDSSPAENGENAELMTMLGGGPDEAEAEAVANATPEEQPRAEEAVQEDDQEETDEIPLKEEAPIQEAVEELKLKLGEQEVEEENDVVSDMCDGQSTCEEEEITMIPEAQPRHIPPAPPLINEEGLIVPRKLQNPCMESMDRQNLHRELMFNQKVGKNVLNQKSELQRALEKHKDAQVRKELEQEKVQSAPELEKVIANRAKKLQENQSVLESEDKGLNKEFLRARAQLRTRTDSK